MSYNPDRINIHELTVEEPEKKEALDISFDPNNIFTDEDWDVLQNMVRFRHDSIQYSSLAIIDTNKLPELSEVSIERIKGSLIKSTNSGNLHAVAWANYVKPTPKFVNIPDDILQTGIKGAHKDMAQCKKSGNWRHFVELAAWLTIMGHRPSLSQEDFEHIEAELESQKAKGYGGYMIEIGAAIAIIYPDYPLSFTLEQSKIIADYIKKGTQEKSWSVEWYQFSAMAKIVADKCREVAARKNLKSETPPIPEAKQF